MSAKIVKIYGESLPFGGKRQRDNPFMIKAIDFPKLP
jgi:hypothetical protein